MRSLIGTEHDPNHLFEALAIDDIRHACDEFAPLFERTGGGDGFVSLEVSPLLASDTKATAEAAKRLWTMVERPNVMIKIPATPEGIPAITETIAAGINVNVTLIFSLETYEEVKRITGYTGSLRFQPEREGDIRHSLADISLAQQVLGYKVVADFRYGLTNTIDWYREMAVPQ